MSSKLIHSGWRQGCHAQRHKTLRQRFAEKLSAPTDTGCVLWLGAHDKDGYGFIRIDGKNVKAHRVALGWKLGRQLLSSEQALHSCDTPACVNDDHLRLGTNSDNQTDASRRGRHAGQRLTVDDVIEIRAKRSAGCSYPKLALEFGVGDSHIAHICLRNKWRHVA